MKQYKWKQYEHRFGNDGQYIGFFENDILKENQSDMLRGLNLNSTTDGKFYNNDLSTLHERLIRAGFIDKV